MVKYQLATISRESTDDKNINHGKSAKVWSQQTVKYRSGGHGSCLFLRYTLIWNINLLPLIGLEIQPWTKILTLIIWPMSEVSRPWNIGQELMALVYFCWSHMKYQLTTINRSWDSALDKNLNLDNLAKVWSQWTMKYRSGGHGSCTFLLVS